MIIDDEPNITLTKYFREQPRINLNMKSSVPEINFQRIPIDASDSDSETAIPIIDFEEMGRDRARKFLSNLCGEHDKQSDNQNDKQKMKDFCDDFKRIFKLF